MKRGSRPCAEQAGHEQEQSRKGGEQPVEAENGAGHEESDRRAMPANALALRDELRAGMRISESIDAGANRIEFCCGRDSFWAVIRNQKGGGFALRLAFSPGGGIELKTSERRGNQARFELSAPIGVLSIDTEVLADMPFFIRSTTRLTPADDLFIPFAPRDLYALDDRDDPFGAKGEIQAAQRGMNTGLVYFTSTKPVKATGLYLQDLTALNDYFLATGSKPDGAIGGFWPELGYQPPTAQGAPNTPKALVKGRDIVISRLLFQLRDGIPHDERASAKCFLDMLAQAYRHIEHPQTQFRDWIERAEATLRHLRTSPKATEKHYGHLYVRPYVDAEYPDCMAQLSVLAPLTDYCCWRDRSAPICGELRAGFDKFYDKQVGAVRRYLPDVGKDKNAEEVDSWYLYHPLANLGRLSLAGDEGARKIFLGSMDYAIRVARRFKYIWPVKFDINTLKVLQGPRKEGQPGQTDVGGLYAYVMLQAYEMTQNKRFLTEAQRAVQALADLEFDLEYQSNITAWGACACLRLWKITGLEFYRDESYVLLAGFFHNTMIWESKIGAARHYSIFMGPSCLHDGPYMAMYECWEAFAAFNEYLDIADDDLPDAVQLLLTEFIKHTLSHSWFYYPGDLPEEILAKTIRNGHIDRKLAFPLEDLYPGGDPAGQVGQEIYGCGAAFSFVKHAFHRVEKAPFVLYCAYPLAKLKVSDKQVQFLVRGPRDGRAYLRLIPKQRAPIGEVRLVNAEGEDATFDGVRTDDGHIEFEVEGGVTLNLTWAPVEKVSAQRQEVDQRRKEGELIENAV